MAVMKYGPKKNSFCVAAQCFVERMTRQFLSFGTDAQKNGSVLSTCLLCMASIGVCSLLVF